MSERERLIELLKSAESAVYWNSSDQGFIQKIADHLLANGVTFTPVIPGPTTEDPNIMELCFRNGENHMRDKIKTSLMKLSADMPCATISQVIKIWEDLQ